MDSLIGLDCILENREYIAQLGTALDTQNTTVKKQVFELLSALCAYKTDGYARAIEVLDFYKNLKKERYRFKIVINELEQSSAATEPPLDYQATLLAFINCVIITKKEPQERIRIRNEFIGLKVLPLLNNLRKVAHSVGNIIVQLDVFVEHQECDEAQNPSWAADGINLNSHLDVFDAILRQVADKPQEGPFLNILQHLLRIDNRQPLSDVIWDTCERLVHRATLIESPEDAVRLLRQQSAQKFTCSACRASDATSPTRKPSQIAQLVQSTEPAQPAQPAQPAKTAANPPPPPPPMGPKKVVLLPQQATPAPKAKMRTVNWSLISQNKVLLDKNNIWSNMAVQHRDSNKKDIDFIELEDLFQLQATNKQGSPKLGRDTNGNQSSSGYDTLDRKAKKEPEIELLDRKRSLNVNIFLKQFRSGHQNLIQLIKDGVHEQIGAERLRGLLNILPVRDELELLQSFNGDRTRLGTAEKFLLQLLEVPNYKLRIKGMLLKEEFPANVACLEPCINAMLYAGDDLLNCKALQELLYLLVVTGNFLNSGGYAGNAAGVKLSSLQKLIDIKSNKPGMDLIHVVALQAERRNLDTQQVTALLNTLENVSKTTVDQINNEIKALKTRRTEISEQVEQPEMDADIKQQMLDFLLAAKSELLVLSEGMEQVDKMREKLANFFCEDPGTFKLEECFKIFQNFCSKFRLSIKENEERVQKEQQATLRRKKREEQAAKRARQLGQAGTPVSDSDSYLGDGLLDPRASPALSRRQLGSGEITNGFIRLEQESSASPDITPNGSLRRRPSRVLAGEDELMEFLRRSTGPYDGHASRDRKVAYGSLDRSIGRRARSGSSSRKRPDLLNIDFGVDRERACSPAPLLQPQPQQQQDRLQSPLASSGTGTPTKTANTPVSNGPTTIHIQSQHPQQQQQQPPRTTAHEDAIPRISREGHQKIQSWLQSNENDEKQNEEYKRKRRLVNANRRSLENESENERKLDPLPEEKIMPATTSTTTTPTNPTNQHNKQGDQESHKPADKYQRVYADWKPSSTLDNTDVVGNIQAIADAATKSQPHLTTAEELRQYRRQRSQEQSQTPGVLHSIAEEDRRKSIIQLLGENDGSADCLKIYLRRPTPMDMLQEPVKPTEAAPSMNTSSTAHEDPFASLLDHHKSHNESQYASKEIDADNIETPPVTRRVLATPNTTVVTVSMTDKPKHLPEEKNTTASTAVSTVESDAPGHFDRHASARRTRRYKRPTDYSSGNEELAPSTNQEIKHSTSANEVRRLQKEEQQREREREREEQADNARNITKLEKVSRHIINQEDVREAIRNLKSPTGTPERTWSPPRELTPSKLKLSVSGHHELNDEGFEETQSLVSDTPSHGKGESTNSSCNEANDAPSQQRSRPLSKQKTTTTSIMGMGMGSRLSDRLQPPRLRGSSTSAAPGSRHNPMPATQTASQASAAANAAAKRSLSASRPLRMPNGSPMLGTTPNGSIRSSSGVRRDPNYALNAPKSRDVERSSSRNSLRSSRSSINSGASTQTVVRRLPSVQRTATVSVDSSPSKRPLATQNARPATARGVPASRSSSSGSSVGPSVILVRSKLTPGQTTRTAQAAGQPLGNNTSFKENQSTSTTAATASASASRLTAARSAVLVKNVLNQQAKTSSNSNSSSSNPQQRNPRQSVSSFMRPTASSVTKRQK